MDTIFKKDNSRYEFSAEQIAGAQKAIDNVMEVLEYDKEHLSPAFIDGVMEYAFIHDLLYIEDYEALRAEIRRICGM